jgi:hypothetical protein
VQTAAILMQFIVVSECKYYNFRTNGGGVVMMMMIMMIIIIIIIIVLNVNSAYKFNVTNINFVLIYINYMPIYGGFYIPGRFQVAYYRKFSNT